MVAKKSLMRAKQNVSSDYILSADLFAEAQRSSRKMSFVKS